jgi:hypothetical protein
MHMPRLESSFDATGHDSISVTSRGSRANNAGFVAKLARHWISIGSIIGHGQSVLCAPSTCFCVPLSNGSPPPFV